MSDLEDHENRLMTVLKTTQGSEVFRQILIDAVAQQLGLKHQHAEKLLELHFNQLDNLRSTNE